MILRQDSKLANLFLKAEEASALYPKTTTTAAHVHQTDASLNPVDGTEADHPVLVLVEVTQTFADGTGAQPTFKIGQTGTAEKFLASATLTGAVVGSVFLVAGELTLDTDLLVTATVATGTATGAIRVTSVAFQPR